MSLVAWCAGVAAAIGAQAAEPAPPQLEARLSALAGAGSRDCGVFALRSDLAAAVACGKDASASGQPFRLAVQLQGDATIWQGAARDPLGRLWVVFYDADASGGAHASPTLSVMACRDIVFDVRGGEVLDCQPYSGQP